MSDQSWTDKSGKPLDTTANPEAGDGKLRAWRTNKTPEMMLLLRFADGKKARAYSYSNLAGIDIDSGVIRLYFFEGTVTILGRHLDELGDYLSQHRVQSVQAQHNSEFATNMQEPYIDTISVKAANVEALARNPS